MTTSRACRHLPCGSGAAAAPSQCNPWHLPRKNDGIIENIPPDDWCLQIGLITDTRSERGDLVL